MRAQGHYWILDVGGKGCPVSKKMMSGSECPPIKDSSLIKHFISNIAPSFLDSKFKWPQRKTRHRVIDIQSSMLQICHVKFLGHNSYLQLIISFLNIFIDWMIGTKVQNTTTWWPFLLSLICIQIKMLSSLFSYFFASLLLLYGWINAALPSSLILNSLPCGDHGGRVWSTVHY